MAETMHTAVAIVGAGPAGLLLSHLLHRYGIDSIVVESRSRGAVESTIRTGILENGTVDLLVSSGASERVLTDGRRHEGIELQFAGWSSRIDFAALVGRAVYLYPQHEVLRDLIQRRDADGGSILFDTEVTFVTGAETDSPRVRARRSDGSDLEIVADFVLGGDGSRSVTRTAVVGSQTGGYFREYPFAWFGILCEAPPSSEELIYANSEHGFALISQRSQTVQRMYLQCDPNLDPSSMTEEQIWESLQARVSGRTLREGPIFQRDVLRFRSFVAKRLRNGRAFLMGDAAHTVPPTGAKGMNLAVHDVRLLSEGFAAFYRNDDESLLATYEERALDRIWRAQHFSWWMTSMLHLSPDATDFDKRRQIGELASVVRSKAGSTYLAEAYTGWPSDD